MLAKVKQTTIAPLSKSIIAPATLGFTDESKISAKLKHRGYLDKSVRQAQGEYARDADCYGFDELHVEHKGMLLVFATFFAQTSPWHFSSKTPTLFGIL